MSPLVEKELISVIEAATGVECYLGVAPGVATLPVVELGVSNDSPLNTRILGGRRVGNAVEIRAGLVANSMPELEELVNKYILIDNTSNDYFQKIYTDFGGRDPFDGETTVFRAFYNITATPR